MFFLHTFILDDFFLYVRLNLTVGICFMGFKQNAKIYWHISRKNDIISSAMYFNFLFYGTIPWGYLMPLLEKLPIVAEEEKWNEEEENEKKRSRTGRSSSPIPCSLSLYLNLFLFRSPGLPQLSCSQITSLSNSTLIKCLWFVFFNLSWSYGHLSCRPFMVETMNVMLNHIFRCV